MLSVLEIFSLETPTRHHHHHNPNPPTTHVRRHSSTHFHHHTYSDGPIQLCIEVLGRLLCPSGLGSALYLSLSPCGSL